jgi:signal transduction histidine kinase
MTSQKLGLMMIAGTLLAIGVIGTVFTLDAEKRRYNEIRAEGVALVRLLGSFAWDELAPEAGNSVLEPLRARIGRSALAYTAIVDQAGMVRAYIGEKDALAIDPDASTSTENWLSERDMSTPDGRGVLEFTAPLARGDALAGSLRVGFFKPGYAIGLDTLPLIAELALPVFLLIPLFYYFLQREMKPLRDVGRRLDDVAARGIGDAEGIVLEPSDDLRTFMDNFNRFLQIADAKVQEAKINQQDMLVHQRLLSYEKGRIEAALQSLPDGVLVIDESGQATFMNDNLTLLLSINRDAVLNAPVEEWDVDESVRSFFRRFNGGKGLHRVETLEFSPSSSPDKTISVSAFPLFSPKETSSVFGAVAIFRDVTAEVLARGARDEFVAHVAHEIKSPLNVINMQAETLAEFGADDAEIRVSSVNVIQDEVERLSRLIGNLLNITQIEAGSIAIDRQPVKLRELIEDAFTTTVRGAEARGIVTRLELPRTLPTVLADKDLLRLALNNLLTNAIKYNRDNGTVIVSAEEHEHEVHISVTDEGLGIESAEQSRVFEKFYRSKNAEARAREGHGLGLPLAKQVIEMHHGSLRLESEPGAGTTFTIVLKKEVNQLKVAV